jgi:hypothetical protein
MKRISCCLLPLLVIILCTAAARGIAEESRGASEADTPVGTAAQAQLSAHGGGELPPAEVVLYSTGVGYFEHRGSIEGSALIKLSFGKDEMKDVLKSLVIRDPEGGTAEAVIYEPKLPTSERLQRLPVRPDEIRTLADLLRGAQGERITVEADETYRGRILSVEEIPAEDGSTGTGLRLTLFSGGRVRSLLLREIADITFADPDFAEQLTAGLKALSAGRTSGRRTVAIRFAEGGKRRVSIGYIRKTPVWKTSYRLEISDNGEHYLQGWAAAENTGTVDWEDVELSFVSGNPISFVMDLYTPLFVDRPILPPPVARLFSSPQYEEGYSAVELAEEAVPAPSPRRSSRSADITGAGPMSSEYETGRGGGGAVQSAAEGSAAGSLFAYRVKERVHLPAGESSLLPIISTGIEGECLSVFPLSSSSSHPLKSLRLVNTSGLHLAAGPITVLEAGMYAGDARIGELVPGGERLISYAVNLEARVVKELESLPEQITELRISGGSLIYTRKDRRSTRYRLINSGPEPAHFLIEHPVRTDGWSIISPEDRMERSPSAYRFLQEVPGRSSPGQPSTALLEVIEERPREQRYALGNADPERIRFYLKNTSPSQKVKEALERVAQFQGELRSLERELSTIQQHIGDIHREQQRIRSNMEPLERDSALYRRYVKELTAQEDRLAVLEERRSELREKLRQRRSDLDSYLQGLEI